MNHQYNYQCPHCKEIFHGEDWDESTFHSVVENDLAHIEDDDEFYEAMENLRVASIFDTSWRGDAWFVCPECYEMSWDEPDHIKKIPAGIHNNKQAKFLLEKSW